MRQMKNITVSKVDADFEREPLNQAFGFKGGYLSDIWQSIAYLESRSGCKATGLCSQNVLWSDAAVYSSHTETGSNAILFALTEFALQQIRNQTYSDPVTFFDAYWPEVYRYGCRITGRSDLKETFALNSLVGVDIALWLLYAYENGFQTFDEMIPEKWRRALSYRNERVAGIPLVPYGMSLREVEKLVTEGWFILKIKMGHPGTQEEMLEKDKQRLAAIHQTTGQYTTSQTGNGKISYYLDANGRYGSKALLLRLLDYASQIGALDQVVLVEEPFPEEMEEDVSDLPVRIAADESAHTDVDALKRIQMGYTAIALKPIAKTLSMTLKIAETARRHDIQCFCADLTVNPVLVEWNKNVAARLSPFSGIGTGLLESNGHQMYKNWSRMEARLSNSHSAWRIPRKGVYVLDNEFFKTGGGIFL